MLEEEVGRLEGSIFFFLPLCRLYLELGSNSLLCGGLLLVCVWVCVLTFMFFLSPSRTISAFFLFLTLSFYSHSVECVI